MSLRMLSRAVTGKPSRVLLSTSRALIHHPGTTTNSANNSSWLRTVVTTPSGGVVEEPKKVPLGVFYAGLTILAGLIVGATISKNMANFLEENEIFAPADDDDDD